MNIEALNSTVIRIGGRAIRVGAVNMVEITPSDPSKGVRYCEVYVAGTSDPVSFHGDQARAFLDEYRSATMSPREYLESRRN